MTARMGVVQSTSEVGDLGEVIRARKPKRLPVVMTREEAKVAMACYLEARPEGGCIRKPSKQKLN